MYPFPAHCEARKMHFAQRLRIPGSHWGRHIMKTVASFAILLGFTMPSLAEDKPKFDARTVSERYLAAAIAGKVDDAIALAVDGQSPGRKKTIEEVKALVGAKALKLPTVWADDKQGQAIAVSDEITLMKVGPDGQNKGHL